MDKGTRDIVHWSAAPHDRKANRTGFSVYVILVLNVIIFIMIYVTITGLFMAINYLVIGLMSL